ncbi:MAG: NAD(P)H-dependent oxidoreductase subunit E [Deltaproteobacteria bacterium]|nr:NAD(P)H-dependent oxidoreductase subunit E [Deltaproteobacteria bacterium]
MSIHFSEKAMKEFKSMEPFFDNPRSKLVPTLYLAQREFGHLSPEVIEYVANLMNLPPAKVLEVASFYTMLHKKPVGKYEIQVCTNVTCSMMKSRELLSHVEKRLKIKSGETTPDKLFTLRREECLGGCDKAPTIRINNTYHYKVTPEKIDEILSRYKK